MRQRVGHGAMRPNEPIEAALPFITRDNAPPDGGNADVQVKTASFAAAIG